MDIAARIIRSNRKTFALIVEADGSVLVRAPRRATQSQIDELLHKKAGWIQEHQRKARLRQGKPILYQNGERFPFQGREYPLEVVERKRPLLALEDGHFRLAQAAQPKAKQAFEAWYRRQAQHVIPSRAQELAGRFGYTLKGVRITSARSRWGSCGANGDLNFSWRLILTPPDCIDYVILHELAHLDEHNHSPAFWARLSALMPDYKEPAGWLKRNGSALMG